MKIALDTNTYTAYLAGDEAIRDKIIHSTDILLPSVVVGELYFGFYNGTKLRENLSYLTQFLRDARVSIGIIDADVARIYGEQQAKLRRNGTPIPTNDIWIAAICIEQAYGLVTRDQDFNHIDGLERVSL